MNLLDSLIAKHETKITQYADDILDTRDLGYEFWTIETIVNVYQNKDKPTQKDFLTLALKLEETPSLPAEPIHAYFMLEHNVNEVGVEDRDVLKITRNTCVVDALEWLKHSSHTYPIGPQTMKNCESLITQSLPFATAILNDAQKDAA